MHAHDVRARARTHTHMLSEGVSEREREEASKMCLFCVTDSDLNQRCVVTSLLYFLHICCFLYKSIDEFLVIY